MLERIFGKPKQEVRDPEPDVKPSYIVPDGMRHSILAISKGKGFEIKKILEPFLKGLNRPDLLAFYDADQFKTAPESVGEWVWEAYYDEEWIRDWPLGKNRYEDTIPDIVRDTIPIKYKRPKNNKGKEIDLDLNALEDQIQGLQKKIDRLMRLVENVEVTMSGKTAINL